MKVYVGDTELKEVGHYVASGDIKDATLTPEKALAGEIFYNNDGQQFGTMPNIGAINALVEAGESISIPEGFHNGNGSVRAKDLASQTQATATAADILLGKTGWVNGQLLTGTHRRVVSGTITVYQGAFANAQSIQTPALDFKPTGAIFLCIADSKYNDPGEDSYYNQGASIAAVACNEYEFTLVANDEGKIFSHNSSNFYGDEGFGATYGDNYIKVTNTYYPFPQGALMLYIAFGE